MAIAQATPHIPSTTSASRMLRRADPASQPCTASPVGQWIDGPDRRWFEDRGDPCTLLVFIDDATSMLMVLRFVQSESTVSDIAALESYLLKHGRPVAIYSDKHTVFRVAFRVAKPSEHMTGMTQFGRALAELNVEILRVNRTLQDRLVKELRFAGVSSMEDGNAFLSGFVQRFNAKFAKSPAKPDNLHRALNIEPDRLTEFFCLRDKRYVTLLGNDFIKHDACGQLLTVTLDDPAPDLSAVLALGCLPLLVAHDVPATTFAAIEGQAKLDERAAHIVWVAGAAMHDPLRGFSACQVVFGSPTGRPCGKRLLQEALTPKPTVYFWAFPKPVSEIRRATWKRLPRLLRSAGFFSL